MQSKITLRLAIRDRLTKLSDHDRDIESRVICKELKKILGETPQTIGVFVPFGDEPDIKPLINDLFAAKWTVCVPKVARDHMVFEKVESLDDVAKNPVTKIPEPIDGEPIDEDLLNVIIVPGRAFTAKGDRIGRGSGGYDRWMEAQKTRNTDTKSIGICFECQIVQEVPLETHDQPVNMVVTSRGMQKI
jgi:5-formyltetrahydrofolate cyclo-ligase